MTQLTFPVNIFVYDYFSLDSIVSLAVLLYNTCFKNIRYISNCLYFTWLIDNKLLWEGRYFTKDLVFTLFNLYICVTFILYINVRSDY